MAILVGFSATLVWGGLLGLDDQLSGGLDAVVVCGSQRLLWPLSRLGQASEL